MLEHFVLHKRTSKQANVLSPRVGNFRIKSKVVKVIFCLGSDVGGEEPRQKSNCASRTVFETVVLIFVVLSKHEPAFLPPAWRCSVLWRTVRDPARQQPPVASRKCVDIDRKCCPRFPHFSLTLSWLMTPASPARHRPPTLPPSHRLRGAIQRPARSPSPETEELPRWSAAAIVTSLTDVGDLLAP